MTPFERRWLEFVHGEADEILHRLKNNDFDHLFDFMRTLFEEQVEVNEVTWEVKNLIASLVATDPEILKGRIILVNAVIERLTTIKEYIELEFSNASTH